jgi:hypothetical protein
MGWNMNQLLQQWPSGTVATLERVAFKMMHLDRSKVEFASGRRTIHAGGRLDKRYDLVVADAGPGEALAS